MRSFAAFVMTHVVRPLALLLDRGQDIEPTPTEEDPWS